jgi:mannose-6-phosphate isomerase-like protein (cupin superfamily)
MQIYHADPSAGKGWYAGPWNSTLGISVGYAHKGIDEPHAHTRITEVYLVACGTATLQVERETVTLSAGDMVAIEPGEAHTFTDSSPEYFHFVVHTPGLSGEAARTEKINVSRERLGV